jgi:type IV pilus assembly protein PilV
VLVAFVLLSIGLLGMVGILTKSKVHQHQAIERARAVNLADDVLERIRINPAAIDTYNIGLDPLGGGTVASEPDPDCSAASCTPAELAAHDLWLWEQALDGASVTAGGANTNGLNTPRGCVVFDASPGMPRTGLLNVIVQWRGLVESVDAVPADGDVCGGAAAGSDPFRRQVSINTYVIDEDDL